MEDAIRGLVDNGKLPAGRVQHEKAHGCVTAEFTVDPNIAKTYQHGIFATPGKSYEAIIRFSSGSGKVQNDSSPDTRGMAIKLFNVKGIFSFFSHF
jgi:catalase